MMVYGTYLFIHSHKGASTTYPLPWHGERRYDRLQKKGGDDGNFFLKICKYDFFFVPLRTNINF